jgi:hypothetical protein
MTHWVFQGKYGKILRKPWENPMKYGENLPFFRGFPGKIWENLQESLIFHG